MVASEDVGIWGGLWMQVMSDLLVPLMADLARLVSTRSKEFPGESQPAGNINLMWPSGLRRLFRLFSIPVDAYACGGNQPSSSMFHYTSLPAFPDMPSAL